MVTGAAIYVGRAIHDEWFWRNDEYAKLQSLKAGFALPYFQQVLGSPVFSRRVPPVGKPSGYTETTFRGRGYWVQALSRRGVVEVYSVTSCDAHFRPSFTIPATDTEVQLRRSRLSEDGDQGGFITADYVLAGASGPSFFYDSVYAAAGGDYKTYLWGVNDACDFGDQLRELSVKGLFGRFGGEYRGGASKRDPALQRFRQSAVVNTYGETAPFVHLGKKLGSFHGFRIGPDRVLLGTAN